MTPRLHHLRFVTKPDGSLRLLSGTQESPTKDPILRATHQCDPFAFVQRTVSVNH